VGDAGYFLILAVDEIATAAIVAGEVVTTVPPDSNALAGFPVRNVCADCVDAACDFVSGNARILKAGEQSFLYHSVAVADAAGFDFDPDLVAAGFGDRTLDEFKAPTRFADLNGSHFGQRFSPEK
jgi:hypothetical protein